MIEEVFLFEADPFVVILIALGEFSPEVPHGGRGKRRPSVYHVPFHPREDDIEEQLERAAHEAVLQQLTEARGVARANREYEKRGEDARALSLLSAQRSRAIGSDPLHRPLPVTAASLQKHLRQERERPSILPKNMQDDLLHMKRDAALQEANRVREEKKKREEEIRQKRLQNLAKARKARRR
jgi:predicted Holliday junction resolvase-like endonuclease